MTGDKCSVTHAANLVTPDFIWLTPVKYTSCCFFFCYKQLNDIRLDCVTHDVAVNEFRKADESVSLLVEKNAETYLLVSIV